MTKQIKVSEETHRRLFDIKRKGEFSTIDEVIKHLIDINRKYENSKIVRLVEWTMNMMGENIFKDL